jgi:hypothetical protein
VAFGPDGNLYVTSQGTNKAVLRFNGTTGAFLDTFVAPSSGGLAAPWAIAFGSDGNLYVVDNTSNAVLRYQGPSGASPGAPLPATGQSGATFVAAGSGGLASPTDLAFGPDGSLYVNNTANALAVLRFDGATGAFLGTAVAQGSGGLAAPRGFAFDQEGRLYVADFLSNAVHRYDGSGQYLDDVVVALPTSVAAPCGLAFDAQGRLLITGRNSNTVVRYDRGVTATLSAPSGTPVSVSYATSDGSATAGADYTAQAGTATLAPGQTSRLILLGAHDDVQRESNETFSVQLSNPTGGATIGTGTATATIVDDDSTRQITVSDTTATEGDTTGKFLDTFVSPDSGGLNTNQSPGGLAFGPDGNFYVGNGGTVLRYNGSTGNFMDTFVGPGPGVRNGPFEVLFMPGGDLLVTYQNSANILRFNGTTGAYVGVFTSGRTLSFPRALAYGPDGNLYVNSETGANTSEIDRFDGATGAFLNVFAASGSGGMDDPQGLVFGPDGNLYVADDGPNDVLRYNGTTGAFIDKYVTSLPAGNSGLYFLTFGPDGNLYVGSQSGHSVFRYGANSQAAFTVTLSTPSSLPLTVDYTTSDGSALAGSDYVSKSGTVPFDAGATSRGILVQSINDATIELPETFNVTLSNPVGGVITHAQGTGTVLDNDTKFYVVNDAATDKTYEYAVSGAAGESYNLGSGNTAPRGAAASADGKTIWVVDSNKTVYVYDPTGALLGSWAAGGLTQPEGITVWGGDVWVVDAGADKLFKYTGAATKLSGSQNADSTSYKLNTSNKEPRGVVTDGTSWWVVDNNTTDAVFKYDFNRAGKFQSLGSWTIDAANASPTGLTINPNNVSDLWIVDSGTKKVYQDTAAAGRTSGSQNAAASFALAANNTNPQDIADPPLSAVQPTPVAPSRDLQPPSVAAFQAGAPGGLPVLAAPPLAGRDAVFARLAGASLPGPGEQSLDLLAGVALTPLLNTPTPVADHTLPPASAAHEHKPVDTLAPLTPQGSPEARSGRSALGLHEGAGADEDSQAPVAAATDSSFADRTEDAPAEE